MSAVSTGCRSKPEELTIEKVKLAFIHIGDPADMGYTYRHHTGTLKMMANLGITEDQVINYLNIPAGSRLDSTINEAIEWGADMIFGTGFGYGPHMLEAAQKNPDVRFFHAAGNLAAGAGLDNFYNYFGAISQARYLSGIAAGMRTETNVLGFVAAHPTAEVITGYTAFYLGALSVNPEVTMYVMYTGAWNDPAKERQAAQTLIDNGADVLGQHADSPATQTTAESNGVWSVGYNDDMIASAPNAVLVSPMFDWSIYLTKAVQTIIDGENMPRDFIAGLNEEMVLITATNPATIVPGTNEAIADARTRIINGFNIFTGPIYSNTGEQILASGEEWVEPISTPSWTHIIQGITIIE